MSVITATLLKPGVLAHGESKEVAIPDEALTYTVKLRRATESDTKSWQDPNVRVIIRVSLGRYFGEKFRYVAWGMGRGFGGINRGGDGKAIEFTPVRGHLMDGKSRKLRVELDVRGGELQSELLVDFSTERFPPRRS